MASEKQERLADIVTEKRARANEIESAAGRDANQFQRELIADLREFDMYQRMHEIATKKEGGAE